jgi:hypothetical protein
MYDVMNISNATGTFMIDSHSIQYSTPTSRKFSDLEYELPLIMNIEGLPQLAKPELFNMEPNKLDIQTQASPITY